MSADKCLSKSKCDWDELRSLIDAMSSEPRIPFPKFSRLCKLNGISSDIKKVYKSWSTDTDAVEHIQKSLDIVNHNINLSKDVRYLCWYFNFGTQKRHRCPCCQNKTIKCDDYWHAGHIKAKSKGGDNNPFTNLIPICPKCNEDMGNTHMAEYVIRPKGAKRNRKRNLHNDMIMIRVEAYKSFNCGSQDELHSLLYSTYLDKKIDGINHLVQTNRQNKKK
jgi:5-methylcytosine-specific restriction endonuclease McrA